MNKSKLKDFAINARLELLQRVADRAALYGIDEEKSNSRCIAPSDAFHKADGVVLNAQEISRRNALVARVYRNGYRQTMEEAAYTWFNRFIALRYMQAHNLLPVPMRVLPDEPGTQPQLVKEAQDALIDGVDMQQVLAMLDANRTEELYRYLLIALCNALSQPLPAMFETISDYTELLFPDGLLKADSVLGQLAQLDAACWNEIQVIGWLYQYYNTELKDETFALLKKNVKITKDRIGAATQLFTPEWIVRYMVENSLGRLWQEGHPQPSLRQKWRYYMDEAEQEPDVAKRLAEIRRPYAAMRPEQITLLDPCMGSGHILVYAFDLLMDIYRAAGYTDRDAVKSIVENNLFGLDIDDRAAQLAYFALMMKACEYDRRFLRRGIQPRVCAIAESAPLNERQLAAFGAERPLAQRLLETFQDAKEYGSILHVDLTIEQLSRLRARVEQMKAERTDLLAIADNAEAVAAVQPLLMQAEALARKYDVVVTNPPYMGARNMNDKLSDFMNLHYENGKSELYAAFMCKCMDMTKPHRYTSMVTIHTWMFISSFEGLRKEILNQNMISSMMHMGAAAFEGVNTFNVLTTAFVTKREIVQGFNTTFLRLAEYYNTADKLENFTNPDCIYIQKPRVFLDIPGSPFVYWMSHNMLRNFLRFPQLRATARPCSGLATGNNDKFVRFWHEVQLNEVAFWCKSNEQAADSNRKWFPYNKGGNHRKWYGMNEYVVNWSNDGIEIRNYKEGGKLKSRLANISCFFKSGITWSLFGFENFSVRYKDNGFVFDVSGSSMFPNEELVLYILAYLIGKVSFSYLSVLAPTVNFQVGNIGDLPLRVDDGYKEQVTEIARESVELSRKDWDSFETSWDFKKHPMI